MKLRRKASQRSCEGAFHGVFAVPPSGGACHRVGTWGSPVEVLGLRRAKVSSIALGLSVALPLLGTVSRADEVARVGPAQTALDAVTLDYRAPPGCGHEQDVWLRVGQLSSAPEGPRNRVEARVTVASAEGGFRISYEAKRDGVSSRRELLVADCAAVVEAAALLLVLTLDPVASEQESSTESVATPPAGRDAGRSEAAPESSPPLTAVTTPSAATVTFAPPVSVPAKSHGSSVGVEVGESWLGLGAEVVTGLAPSPGRGVRLELGTTLAGLKAGVWGSYDWVGDSTLSQAPFAHVESHLYRLRLWSGPAFRVGVVQLGPLVALGAEHLRAEVVGITGPAPGSMTWLSVAGGGHLDVHLAAPLALRVETSAVLSLERRSFFVRGLVGHVHQPTVIGVEAGASLLWAWGAR